MSDDKQTALQRVILAYLSKRPKAQDTAEGIARFWVSRQRLEECLNEVQEALQHLVEAGTLEVVDDPGNVSEPIVRYRLKSTPTTPPTQDLRSR